MNKKIVFVIISLTFLIMLLVSLFLLKKENKKIEVPDLYCYRNNDYIDYKYKEQYTYKFDENNKPTEYIVEEIVTYPNEEEAKAFYQETISINPNSTVELEKNNVIFYQSYLMDNQDNLFDKTREKIKDVYINKLFFECGD